MPTSVPPGKSPKGITILPCRSRRELRRFEDCAEDVLGEHPSFVPPLPGSVAESFRSGSPFLKAHGELAPFLALRDGRPVGRIAAVLNRTHNEYHGDRTGFFGFFDFADDETAEALFETATGWLHARGRDNVRGPYSLSVNEVCGLLTEGFEDPPAVFMPWNPPRYVDTYRRLGLAPVRTLYSFDIRLNVPADPTIAKLADRTRRRSGLTTRAFDLSDIEGELRILQRLYNVTLDRNWGYVPVKWEDLEHSAKGLKAIADPGMIYFVMHGDREVGYSISLPDINDFLHRTRPWPRGVLRLLPMLWMLKTSKPRRARHLILGIEPEFRHHVGLAPLLYHTTFQRVGGCGYDWGEISWIEANNEQIVRGIEMLGGTKGETYTLWEKLL
ncbi:MAG: hypothetical protein ACO39C_02110 [Chthoniobacterales bacterium]